MEKYFDQLSQIIYTLGMLRVYLLMALIAFGTASDAHALGFNCIRAILGYFTDFGSLGPHW
jgi:hypothetical protein